ncbi:MAG: N-6 DNA methylase [Gemmataceae bacterium]
MARARKSAPAAAPTTAQRLAAALKSARDLMRKDKGLNGDLDRLPLLTWLLFLKFLDDHEREAEAAAVLARKAHRPALEPPYRWRDWANRDGFTGDALLHFLTLDSAARPDGSIGPGLLPHLATLAASTDPRRRVVGKVSADATVRMKSGYLLFDLCRLIDGIRFQSAEEISTLGALYESMLKEMRDAAGDSGEFYTPRPVVKFIVKAVNPRLGELVLDPACGTGGFLTEAFEHLKAQAGKAEDFRTLQAASVRGQEAKPLPYLLGQMNLFLHGLEEPDIRDGNSLAVTLTELTAADQADVILTNPPFGGEEEAGVQNGFPADRRTSETALLFLQLIMRRLKPGGRAAVVVPNGTLFGDGVAARIKHDLLAKYHLHTVVRLPNGVFAPYTSIPTNVLFFDRTGPTADVWYYELPPPAGAKQYSKTKPIPFEAFADCLAWWPNRAENERAWKVSAAELTASGCNLDRKNPNAPADAAHRPPQELVASILEKEKRIADIIGEIKAILAEGKS